MISYNEQYDLYVPDFEPRLMDKDWFIKTFNNIGRELLYIIEATRGDNEKICVQAGAHLGIYPKYLSKHFDEVFTFEPDPILYDCVKKNIIGANITAINAALSDTHKSVDFYRTGKSGTGTLDPNQGFKGEIFKVSTMTIDSLDLQGCDALLLDIERHESKALLGAVETIRKFSPIIQVEMHDDSKEEINDTHRAIGYHFVTRAGSRDQIYMRK